MLEQLRIRFPLNGSFTFKKGDILSKLIKRNQVPDKPGIYLIYSSANIENKLVYVGKAGTLKNNGDFRKQKLQGRLKAKQSGKSRQKYFTEIIEVNKYTNLEIFWFVTFYEENKTLPSLVENEILQQYFDLYFVLPKLNKTI